MDITPLVPKDSQVITHYGNGGFVINGVAHKGNILLLPDKVVPWEVQSIADAGPESFRALLAGDLPEIMLIGVGPRFMPLAAGLREFFREKGVAVDMMDTGAACRTYTVLLAEGRQVAAALIAV
jgi:uncharacterized protein